MTSKPYVAFSTVNFPLVYQSTGVWFTKWRIPGTALPVARWWYKFASTHAVWMTSFTSVYGCIPSIFRDCDPRVVWQTSVELNCSMLCFGNVPKNPLDSIHVAFMWFCSSVGNCHHGSCNVAMYQQPKESAHSSEPIDDCYFFTSSMSNNSDTSY